MAGLASKWAPDTDLVNRAVKQDKVPKREQPTKLVSKWADEKVTQKPEKHKGEGKHKAVEEKKHDEKKHDEKKHDEKLKRKPRPKSRNRRNSLETQATSPSAYPSPPTTADGKEKKKSHEAESDDEKGPMTSSAKVLAARLGVVEPKSPKKAKPRKEREQRHKEPEKKPMTAAAQSLALRIGAVEPKNAHEEDKPVSYAQASRRPKSKYLTPRQKKDMQEQEQRALEDAARDEKLKAEVQAMFDKMDNKSSSWADIDWADE